MMLSVGRSCTTLTELSAALMVLPQAPCALMVLPQAPCAVMVLPQAPCALMVLEDVVLRLLVTVLLELGTALMVQVTARFSAVLTELHAALTVAAGNTCALVVLGL